MIISVSADRKSFKTVKFNSGFNVVLAERTKESTKKDSRNGLGKSTLIEIIHFCLGANKDGTLKSKELDDWNFKLELSLENKVFTIVRNTKRPGKVLVAGDISNWPIRPQKDLTGMYSYSTKEWISILGSLFFKIDNLEDYGDLPYKPSFRSLISYFIRRNSEKGGFLSPFEHFKKQREWNKQVNNAFLLGLPWNFASKTQVLKDRENVLQQIKKESDSGILSDILGSIGELEAKKVRLEKKVEKDKNELDNFRVHPQYKQIEDDVNSLTEEIHNLVNENFIGKQLVDRYENSFVEEKPTDPNTIIRMYKEAKIVIPVLVKKEIEQVLSFYQKINENRQNYLSSEVSRLKNEINERENNKKELSDKRAELMDILKRHGALEEYTRLQERHQKIVIELEATIKKLQHMRNYEKGKSAIKVEKEILVQETRIDLSEREKQKTAAILCFNENSNKLYSAPGTLSIDVQDTGYKFKVDIERSGSHGIGNMKIFCYDLMLAELWTKKRGPDVVSLIHDSILFADVDERQKALALELAAEKSERHGFQYICTLNSDTLPLSEFSESFNLKKYIILTLTDREEQGSLLGKRF